MSKTTTSDPGRGRMPQRPTGWRRWLPLALPAAILVGLLWAGLRPVDDDDDAPAGDGEIWTCSMHPQIRQPAPGLCPICEMDLIRLEGTGEAGGLRELSVSGEAAALLDLRVAPARVRMAEKSVPLLGRIVVNERTTSNITARVGGRIERLFVDFTGAEVEAGAHLAEIYSPDLLVAQRELIEAVRGLADPGASEAVRDARRRLLQAARERLRLLQLPEEQIREIEQLDAPQPVLEVQAPQDGVVIEKLVSPGDYVETGEVLLKVADLSQVWLMLDAYESDLPWLAYGQDVSFTVAALPGESFHGRVTFVDPQVDARRRVAAVRVEVDNTDRRLKPGAFASAEVRARVDAAGKVRLPELAGKWISPMHPEIIKDGPGACDICGMDLVPVERMFPDLAREPGPDPLMIPRSAVLRTGERSLVYVRQPEEPAPVFEGRVVVTGPVSGDHVVVLHGLEPGELVVSRGAFKLDSELQIKGRPSLMSPNAGLEQRPAGQGPDDLMGQWPPVLRGWQRLTDAVGDDDRELARTEMDFIAAAVRRVRTDSLQDDELALWQEFRDRLLADLVLAEGQLDSRPRAAADIVGRSIDDAGRHLGLAVEPLPTPADDAGMAAMLAPVLDAYFDLVTALADDDAGAAVGEAARVREAVAAAPWPQPWDDKLNAAAAGLAEADPGLDELRAAFEPLSRALIDAAGTAADRLGNLHVIHCPMVDEDGADWLWPAPEVLNPYHGASMLRCGNVTGTISFDPKDEPEPPADLEPADDADHDDHADHAGERQAAAGGEPAAATEPAEHDHD